MKQKSENGLSEVRKLNSQKNQFVNLNHLRVEKKIYSAVWEVKDCNEFFALFPLSSLYFTVASSYRGNNLSVDFICEKFGNVDMAI